MKGKIIGITTLVVVLALSLFVYFRFYFVFGEGVKAGELNFVVYKGYIFKTYEGRAIQAGFGKGERRERRNDTVVRVRLLDYRQGCS